MLNVALTGGIASGKSTIAGLFSRLGVRVIDTDDIARDLMQPGQPGYQRALDHFGPGIMLPDQTLDRRQLRSIVFNDAQQRQWLESMLHPLIREQARESMDTGNRRPYQILVVPLLFESGFDSLVDHVIAIDCPAEVQLQRLVTRDGISRQLARQMIDAQMTNDERRSRADTTIGNADNTDRTGRVLTIHQELSASGQGNAGVT